jgi:hypothetical protein
MQPRREFRRLTTRELQVIFNTTILPRVSTGEMGFKVERSTHLEKERNEELPCTQTQTLSYYDAAGNEIARAHQYLRADGTIGASGLPDPKVVYEVTALAVVVYTALGGGVAPPSTE